MIKRLLPVVVAVASLASVGYTLAQIDQVVQGTLYSYGLQFNPDWANPYWTLLKVTWALLAICAVATIFNTIVAVRPTSEKQLSVKIASTQKLTRSPLVTTQTKEAQVKVTPITLPASPPQPSEKPTPKPTPIIAPAPSYTNTDIPGLFKCSHCGKAFTQPLRMLDFHGDPPRIVNVCPFCSETMPSESSAKESERNGHKSLFKKDNNHGQKSFTS